MILAKIKNQHVKKKHTHSHALWTSKFYFSNQEVSHTLAET